MDASSAPIAAVAQNHTVAVLVPCHNEAATIAQVIADFRAHLPAASIYVYDNNSTDDTARLAAAAGAHVRAEPLQGKGNVVRRMFSDIEADVFILVDGDGTYTPPVRRDWSSRSACTVSTWSIAPGCRFPPRHFDPVTRSATGC